MTFPPSNKKSLALSPSLVDVENTNTNNDDDDDEIFTKANSSVSTEQTVDISASEDEHDRATLAASPFSYQALQDEENPYQKRISMESSLLDRSGHSIDYQSTVEETKSLVTVKTAPLSYDHFNKEETERVRKEETERVRQSVLLSASRAFGGKKSKPRDIDTDAIKLHQEKLMKRRMERHLRLNGSNVVESQFYFDRSTMSLDGENYEDDSRLIDTIHSDIDLSSSHKYTLMESDDLNSSKHSIKSMKENFKKKIRKRLSTKSSRSRGERMNNSQDLNNSLRSTTSQENDQYDHETPVKDQELEDSANDEDKNKYGHFGLSPSTAEGPSKQSNVTNESDVEAQENSIIENVPPSESKTSSQPAGTPPHAELKRRKHKSKQSNAYRITSQSTQATNAQTKCTFTNTSRRKCINSTIYYDNEAFHRLSRQTRLGRKGPFLQRNRDRKQTNRVRLHVYDLFASETYVEFPWGCSFPIGKCFNAVNTGLHALGTGAYHAGIEVNGVEYSFGANNTPGLSGVFTCEPMNSIGYEYRTTIDFGERQSIRKIWITVPKSEYLTQMLNKNKSSSSQLHKQDSMQDIHPTNKGTTQTDFVYRQVELNVSGLEIMREMANEYMGLDYDLLRNNCCTFARDACLRLGVKESEIPTWFMNIAKAGAQTEDTIASMEKAMRSPIDKLTSCNEGTQEKRIELSESGFEVIVNNEGGAKGNISIVESSRSKSKLNLNKSKKEESVGIRETSSWTY